MKTSDSEISLFRSRTNRIGLFWVYFLLFPSCVWGLWAQANDSWWASLTLQCSELLWAPTGRWWESLHRCDSWRVYWPARAMTQQWHSHHPLFLCSEAPLHSQKERTQLCVSRFNVMLHLSIYIIKTLEIYQICLHLPWAFVPVGIRDVKVIRILDMKVCTECVELQPQGDTDSSS